MPGAADVHRVVAGRQVDETILALRVGLGGLLESGGQVCDFDVGIGHVGARRVLHHARQVAADGLSIGKDRQQQRDG